MLLSLVDLKSILNCQLSFINGINPADERQGILVEEKALRKAEKECLADEDLRIQRRVRDAKRHELQDLANIETFIDAILNLYPGCPFNTAKSITEHACLNAVGVLAAQLLPKDLLMQPFVWQSFHMSAMLKPTTINSLW